MKQPIEKELNEQGMDIHEIALGLHRIEVELKKQRSIKRIIMRAVINGVFISFGATIVFAILLIILAKAIQASNQIPILNDIIERTKLEQLIEDQDGK